MGAGTPTGYYPTPSLRRLPMRTDRGKSPKPKQKVAAKPLADPDALVPDVPGHVKRPDPTAFPTNPVVIMHKLNVKAIKQRLRS